MFRKSFLVTAMLFAFAAASFAADIVSMDLNYNCRGNLKLLSKLPEGITMSGRKDYKQKKFAGHCLYTVRIDVNKVQEFELELEVVDTGDKDSAKLNPSLSPSKGLVVDCLAFDVNGKPAARMPRKITKWTGMQSVMVKAGQKITIKCKLAKSSAPVVASGSTVSMDLNYKCRGNLKLLSKLPEGITMSDRKDYKQKKFAGECLYTVRIDVNKVQEFELELEVVDTGDKDSAELSPSLWVKGPGIECTEFETGDEPASTVPCKLNGWKRMQTISVAKGEKITIKGKFKKVTAAK